MSFTGADQGDYYLLNIQEIKCLPSQVQISYLYVYLHLKIKNNQFNSNRPNGSNYNDKKHTDVYVMSPCVDCVDY